VAVAAAGAEKGVFGGQRGRLDLVDGVGRGILRRDGGAALALAHQWALRRSATRRQQEGKTHRGLGLVLARQLLQVRKLVVGRHEAVVGHAEVRKAAVRVRLRMRRVLVVKDRGALR
jgi:hypothetical protein